LAIEKKEEENCYHSVRPFIQKKLFPKEERISVLSKNEFSVMKCHVFVTSHVESYHFV